MRKEVQQFLLEQNVAYYKRMVSAFPNEPIWKKALEDANKLLKREGIVLESKF